MVAVELLVIGLVAYVVVRFVQGTRAAGALKGMLVILVLVTVATRVLGGVDSGERFERLGFLYERALTLLAFALIVVFQPELRRALVRVGEARLFRSTPGEIATVVEQVVDACMFLSKARFGAIIVFEREVRLGGLAEGGTHIGAEVSAPLIQTVFYPGSALHDLALIIRGRVIDTAGAQLPLANAADMPDPTLGSRHRAAVGLTKECDAVVVVVSEETGKIRIAERGRLEVMHSEEQLRGELKRRLGRQINAESPMTAAEASAIVDLNDADPDRGDEAAEPKPRRPSSREGAA